MVAKPLYRRLLRICLWYLAVVLVFALALTLVEAYQGSLVFAAYPGPLEFTGLSRLSGTTYVVVKWVRNPAAPVPCPLIVHLPAGDIGETEFAEPDRLRDFGLEEVPFVIVPEALPIVGPDWQRGLPRVIRFGHGDLRIVTQHTDGALTCVWVGVVEPGQEMMAWSPRATPYSISVNSQRLTLPVSEAELVRALGVPPHRRKDY